LEVVFYYNYSPYWSLNRLAKTLRAYYDSLTSLLENYVREHAPEGTKLES